MAVHLLVRELCSRLLQAPELNRGELEGAQDAAFSVLLGLQPVSSKAVRPP